MSSGGVRSERGGESGFGEGPSPPRSIMEAASLKWVLPVLCESFEAEERSAGPFSGVEEDMIMAFLVVIYVCATHYDLGTRYLDIQMKWLRSQRQAINTHLDLW